MPGLAPDGIQIAETPGVQCELRPGEAPTAFIGRTLRGPVNTPVAVRSVGEFQQLFGGLWQPSPLSYAVEHFFEQGGRVAVIVRVVNDAAPTTISLACDHDVLELEARVPGTREFLRASVDYDHIDDGDRQRFNLVVQRVRAPGSERIECQETFRGISVDPSSPRFVARVLLESTLVRVRGPVPAVRPNLTLMPGTSLPAGYVDSNPDGDDGRPLSDYDIIGSAIERTGLFALSGVEDLGFVYIPPLSRTQDIGVSALLVAARFCRERRALLIVDPPASWDTPDAAIERLRQLNFHSDDAVMFFPRIACRDRLRGRSEIFGNGGAVAGILSRQVTGESALPRPDVEPEPVLRAGVRLSCAVNGRERARLLAHGINVLQTVRSAQPSPLHLRTLSGGSNASADWGYLAPRRFALTVLNTIERGTRWALATDRGPGVWQQVTRQVTAFMRRLHGAGAFGLLPEDQAFAVVCDERLNDAGDPPEVNILVQFASLHSGEHHGFMISHGMHGSSVRPVAVNRLETARAVAEVLERETPRQMERRQAAV